MTGTDSDSTSNDGKANELINYLEGKYELASINSDCERNASIINEWLTDGLNSKSSENSQNLSVLNNYLFNQDGSRNKEQFDEFLKAYYKASGLGEITETMTDEDLKKAARKLVDELNSEQHRMAVGGDNRKNLQKLKVAIEMVYRF